MRRHTCIRQHHIGWKTPPVPSHRHRRSQEPELGKSFQQFSQPRRSQVDGVGDPGSRSRASAPAALSATAIEGSAVPADGAQSEPLAALSASAITGSAALADRAELERPAALSASTVTGTGAEQESPAAQWAYVQSCYRGARSRLAGFASPHRLPQLVFRSDNLLSGQKHRVAHDSGLDIFPWFQMRWQQTTEFEGLLLSFTKSRSELLKDAVEQRQETVFAGIFSVSLIVFIFLSCYFGKVL